MRRVEKIFQIEDVEAWTDCFVVASHSKIRAQKPPGPISPKAIV